MNKQNTYDVLIIGAGVTGTAAFYTLARYTNVKKIGLIEKYSGIAQVQSAKNSNSQTLHFGDIETNYSLEKAKKVKAGTELVKNYILKYGEDGKKLYSKYQKMVLAVGKEEIRRLKKRTEEFHELFPHMKGISREEIEKLEPNVVKGREKKEELYAMYSPDGYAVDFGSLAESYVEEAKKELEKKGGTLKVFFESPVQDIKKVEGAKDKTRFVVRTKKEEFLAKTVLVAASAQTLKFANQLGYGEDLILLPVAGSFFRSSKKLLRGKVYMMQNPKMPFAAMHGDPMVLNPNETRFGPTAKVLPMLERRKLSSIWDFIKLVHYRKGAISALLEQIKDPDYLRFIWRNLLLDIPLIGKYFFLHEIRKIVPSVQGKDIVYQGGIGGIRPQIINVKTKKMALGEAKITGDHILFNITPSPGASTSLASAKEDIRQLVKFLGEDHVFDEKRMERELGGEQ